MLKKRGTPGGHLRLNRGFTLLETLLGVALAALILVPLSVYGRHAVQYFQHQRARQMADTELRIALNTLDGLLADALASSVELRSPANPNNMQFQELAFETVEGSQCTIRWSPEPANTLRVTRQEPGGIVQEQTIAHNIASFGVQWDPGNPNLMRLALTMRYALDQSQAPGSIVQLFMSTDVRLVSATP